MTSGLWVPPSPSGPVGREVTPVHQGLQGLQGRLPSCQSIGYRILPGEGTIGGSPESVCMDLRSVWAPRSEGDVQSFPSDPVSSVSVGRGDRDGVAVWTRPTP